MHSYSIDTNIRRVVHVAIAFMSLLIPSLIGKSLPYISLSEGFGFSISFGTIFGILYYLFDFVLWKKITSITSVPDLNGKWEAKGNSSYINPETNENYTFEMTFFIKQTFSKIEISSETENSTSRSVMAGLSTQHAVPIFRYTFENIPKNMADPDLQRHPGLIELRILSKNEMSGDYFSGKHRLNYGELVVRRI